MLVIRFSRVGKKNRAQFRIVAQERTMAPSGKHVEILGSYDPHFKKGVFKKERIEHWVKNGAQISDSVYNVLVSQGIIKGKKRFIKITAKKEKGKKEGKEKQAVSNKQKETSEEVGKEDKVKETKAEEKGEAKEEKQEKVKSLATSDLTKPEKTEEVKKEEKKEKPEKKEEK